MRGLIATGTAGGHLVAAALEEAWKNLRSHDIVQRLSMFLNSLRSSTEIFIPKPTSKLSRMRRSFTRWFSKKTDNHEQVRKMSSFRRTFARRLTTSEALTLGKLIFILNPIPGARSGEQRFPSRTRRCRKSESRR